MDNQQNQQTNSVQNQTPIMPQQTAPEKHAVNVIWPLALIFMVLVLLGALFFKYSKQMPFVTEPTTTTQNAVSPANSRDIYMEDKAKDETVLNDEIINEIDELQSSEVQSAYDEKYVDDIK